MKTIRFFVYSLILIPAFAFAQDGTKVDPYSGEKNDWIDIGGGEGELRYYNDYRDQKVELQDHKRDARDYAGKDCDGQYVESGNGGEGHYTKVPPNGVGTPSLEDDGWELLPNEYQFGIKKYRLWYKPVTGDRRLDYGVEKDEIVRSLLQENNLEENFLKNNSVYVDLIYDH